MIPTQSRDFSRGFDLTETELRRLHEVVTTRLQVEGHEQTQNNFVIAFRSQEKREFNSLEDVFKLENQGRSAIKELTMKSGLGGAFQFNSLSNGQYSLCVQALGTVWLDPCEWRTPVTTVQLSSSQRSASVTVKLKKGVAIPIRIDDPAQLLTAHEGKTAGAHLLIGIINPSFAFRPAIVVSNDISGRNHQVVIPFDKTVNLLVSSSFFQIHDDKSGISNPGTTVPLFVPSGQQSTIVNFRVSAGGKP